MGAGLPDWRALITTLSFSAGLPPAEQQALSGMNFLDAARIIEQRLMAQGKESLGRLVARAVQSRWYTLSHALLAGQGAKVDGKS